MAVCECIYLKSLPMQYPTNNSNLQGSIVTGIFEFYGFWGESKITLNYGQWSKHEKMQGLH